MVEEIHGGSGFREQGTGFREQGGSREQGAGFREQGTGNRVQGAGSRVQGTGSREQGTNKVGGERAKIANRQLLARLLPYKGNKKKAIPQKGIAGGGNFICLIS
jgi:hypothetical protein